MKVVCKGLLFDMDGVLINSANSGTRCWRVWAAEYGLEGAAERNLPHGVRAVDIMRMWVPGWAELGVDAPEIRDGLRRIEDLEIGDAAELKVLPGVRELLGALRPEEWTIVTSASRRLLEGRLAAAGLPFPDRIVTADDVVKGKPDPEPYRKGAELLGFASSECVVVEDAPSGVGAGLAAGSKVLGVLGTHAAEELKAAGADFVVTSLAGVGLARVEGGLELEFEEI